MGGPWSPVRAGAPRSPKCRLICFHHAGGSALAYRTWRFDEPSLEVLATELPGRGRRMAEAPVGTLREAAAALAEAIVADFADVPFAFFGYSLGGTIAFECARALRARGGPLPRYLALGAASAPGARKARTKVSALPHDAFVEALRALDGTPREVFDEPELLELLLPMLRADFRILEDHAHVDEAPLDLTLRTFAGVDDEDASELDVAPWGREARHALSTIVLPGGHFFLHDAGHEVRSVVKQDLASLGLL